jgi:hypothetical protein
MSKKLITDLVGWLVRLYNFHYALVRFQSFTTRA